MVIPAAITVLRVAQLELTDTGESLWWLFELARMALPAIAIFMAGRLLVTLAMRLERITRIVYDGDR